LRSSELQLKKVIKLCPYNAAAYLCLGRTLLQQGKIFEAQKILNRLVELKPNSAQGHLELAKMYRTLRDYKKAVRHMSASLSIEPALSIELHVVLAEAYYRGGDINKAIQTVSEAIESFPEEKTAEGHAYLGYLLGIHGEYKKALDESRLALKIDPNCANRKGFHEYLRELEARIKP